jgi:glucosamine--fructose-6-phosphate aminotransferase (isomerizing)
LHRRPEIQDIPRALRQTLEKAKPEYAELIRQTRWGEGPIYVCACGGSTSVSLVGAYAFECLLGWPVVVRTAAVFQNYSSSVLQPRSILLVISASGEAPEALHLARLARSRGAILLAMTNNPASQLAKSAQGVILTRAESADDTPATAA